MAYDAKYFRGQGRVLIRAVTDSVDKLRFVGNVSDLQITTQQQKTDHQESYTGERRTDLRMVTQTSVTLSITLEDTQKQNWQLALKASTAAQAGATVSAESHTAPLAGEYFPLAKKNITSITSITSDPAGTTFVAGTDYVATPPSNLIYVPTGSALVSDPILVNYVAGAADVIFTFNATDTDYYLYFDGLNTVDSDAPVVIEIFKVNFDSAGQMALISDNLFNFQLNATALYDTANDLPLDIAYRIGRGNPARSGFVEWAEIGIF